MAPAQLLKPAVSFDFSFILIANLENYRNLRTFLRISFYFKIKKRICLYILIMTADILRNRKYGTDNIQNLPM